jgi:hypothetical protein
MRSDYQSDYASNSTGETQTCQCLARRFSSSTSHAATQLIERFASDDPAEVPSLDGTHRVERSKLDRPVARILLIAPVLESRSDCFEPRVVGLSGQAVQGGVYTHLQVDHLPNCAHEHIEIVGVDGRAWNYPFRWVAGTTPEWHSDGNRRSNPRSWLVANQGYVGARRVRGPGCMWAMPPRETQQRKEYSDGSSVYGCGRIRNPALSRSA